jgi:4-amino-4-deoxy-L-arabinose transferase-like glycosyltransferase
MLALLPGEVKVGEPQGPAGGADEDPRKAGVRVRFAGCWAGLPRATDSARLAHTMARQTRMKPAAPAMPAPALAPAAPEPPPDAREPAPQFGDRLPSFVAEVPWLRWLYRFSGEQRVALGMMALAAVLYVPFLGAVGFWDPWEPHYGEVAREMIARGDYIHPWWESVWFFSKPALDLWLMAAGMLAAGTNGPDRYLGVYTEWLVRLPYMAITVLGVVVLFFAVSRLVNRRVAILSSVAMLCSPLTVFYAHQAVPDPIFVGLLSAAMGCLAIALFEREPQPQEPPRTSGRDGWLIAFYCFVGLATLSKGLLGFALPGAVVLFYCLVTGEWHRLRRLRLLTGALIVLAICGPWYGTLFGFDGRDEDGKTFFERFIIHDHFKRLAVGVHTTTPGGTFVYFIEQLGFDCFPWVFAFPGAIAAFGGARLRPRDRRERMLLFLLLWLLIGFAVFAFSVTKFHHYGYPIIPPLLVFCALWLDRVLEDGLRAHAGELLAGALFYALVAHDLAMTPKHLTDLFVYNYDRPYPDREVDPRQTFELLFYAAPAVALSPWLFDRVAQLWNAARATLRREGRRELRATLRDRLAGVLPERAEAPQDRSVLMAGLLGLALAFSFYLGWSYWRRMSPHWTQRDFFYLYYNQSQPDEPIGAYLMNWRGETFYSRNTVRQLKEAGQLQSFMAGPGRRKWLLVEQARLAGMRQALQPNYRVRVVEARNIKFVLAVAEPVTPQAPQGGAPFVQPGSNPPAVAPPGGMPSRPPQGAAPQAPSPASQQGQSGGSPAPAQPPAPPSSFGAPP